MIRLTTLLLGVAAFLLAAAGGAEAANVELGKMVFKEKIECNICHGWAGDGQPDDPHASKGANLRATLLTREQLIEVVKCGRPGTAMPYFDARAYKDNRCYGVTAADLGDQTPHFSGTALIGREVDALVDYLQAKVIGAGPVTQEQCEEFFGGSGHGCDRYPAAATLPAQPAPRVN